jgi:hypothetical protein
MRVFSRLVKVSTYQRQFMNDTQDITTLTIRIVIFIVILGVFYFVLKEKK